MVDIDIEAANKIRVAMGLKPLPVPGAAQGPVFKDASDGSGGEEAASTLETRQAVAGDNWLKLKEEAEAKAQRLAQKETIKKARDRAMRDIKLKGKTLGDVSADQDAASWLRQQSKRQKKIDKARRLEDELAAREQQAQYTSEQLAGVKVGHELGQFETGSEQILTLKDAVIGDESEEDELENMELRAEERLKERLERKKKKPVYNPNDTDETGDQSILAQYDEEIDGKRRHKFTLDGQGNTKEQLAMADAEASQKSKGVVINLDILKDDKPVSDYMEPSDIKIRKPKKKKSKSTRKRAIDDDDIFPATDVITAKDTGMDVDDPSSLLPNPKKRSLDVADFADDDDLQGRLAQQRREALKKRKFRVRPEDLARQLREEEESAMDGVIDSTEEAPGLVLDETTEFLANLKPEVVDDGQQQQQQRLASQPRIKSEEQQPKLADSDSEEDVDMEQSYGAIEDAENRQDADGKASPVPEVTATGLDEESTLNHGLGSTLAMLRQRKLVEGQDHGELNSLYRSHEEFIAEKRNREDDGERKARQQRERDRVSGRLDRMSAREREEYARQNNAHREQLESRDLATLFNKHYQPNVDLKYIDEFGRHMNQKEAFKHLSHQFHGKGSGKQKHEKRLKKIDEEKKREAMSALDSSQHSGMNSAMGDKAKKSRQAGVRLQ